MLNDDEKKDLLAGMVSDSRRLDFKTMRLNTRPPDPPRMDLDELIDFLEAALRLANLPTGPRTQKPDYPRSLI
jgi:hypothetical protein